MAKLPQMPPQIILRVAIAVPVYRLFDYLASPGLVDLSPGIRLEVPFGAGIKIAYLIETSHRSEIAPAKLKEAGRILDEKSLLSEQDIKLLCWVSNYYHYPLGEVFSAAFPASLRSGKAADLSSAGHIFMLTQRGKELALNQLKRFPKQQKLLDFFQKSHSNQLSEAELRLWDKNWRPALKCLITKGLISELPSDEVFPVQIKPPKVVAKSFPALNPGFEHTNELELNSEQQTAIAAVVNSLDKFEVFLLEGVTGSGKTEVYMQIIRSALEMGRQVVVLVPEINLTPQLEERFRKRFSIAMTVTHSNLTNKQRHLAWMNMQQGISAILLGTRSALFTPLKEPGLIILDEEHDTSFKQQEGLRFSARDVAIMRAKLLNIPVLLGSATPSLESLYNAIQKRYRYLRLTKRAGIAATPSLHLMDIRNKKMHNGLSEALISEMRKVFASGEQILMFLNRRGFAPTLICHGCGWVARCKLCDTNLVVHNNEQILRCHHCGKEQRLLLACPACTNPGLIPLGLGTERIEETLRALFPDKILVRLDRDTTQKKGSLEHLLTQINEGTANIILGTQMVAKGHHFPNVTLVVIIDVDGGLFSIDYRASERMAQTITQVSGRAGRAEKPGKVILQTRHPEHPLLKILIQQGYNQFALTALAERKQAKLPPFSYHALLRSQGSQREAPRDFLQAVAEMAKGHQTKQTQILGPIPAPMEKRAGVYRYQLLFQSGKRSELQKCLASLISEIETIKLGKKIHWSLDVDPADMC